MEKAGSEPRSVLSEVCSLLLHYTKINIGTEHRRIKLSKPALSPLCQHGGGPWGAHRSSLSWSAKNPKGINEWGDCKLFRLGEEICQWLEKYQKKSAEHSICAEFRREASSEIRGRGFTHTSNILGRRTREASRDSRQSQRSNWPCMGHRGAEVPGTAL